MEIKIIDILIQGGAVGISVALILLVYKITQACAKSQDKIVSVVEKNASVMQELSDNIKTNTSATFKMSESVQNMNVVAAQAMKLKVPIKTKVRV